MIPLAEGGVIRRPGSRYVAEIKDSSVKGRLRAFEFSDQQAYMIELASGALRFYRHQAQIVVADTDAAITNGTFTSNINDWDDRSTGGAGNQITHDATNGRMTLEVSGTAADDIGWAEQDVTVSAQYQAVEHVLKLQVLGSPGNRIEVRIGSTSTGSEILTDTLVEVGYRCIPFTPNATTFYVQFRNRGNFRERNLQIDNVSIIDNAPVEVDTPYAEADLFTLSGPQSADVLYLFSTDQPAYKLERRGNTDWAMVEIAWQDGPWGPNNEGKTSTTLTPAAVTGVFVTVTASSTEGINDGQGFLSTDLGRLVRIDNPATGVDWGWGIIVTVTNTTTIQVDILRDFATTNADDRWMLGSWSGTTGYPAVGTFYQQRLVTARTIDQIQTFWASNTSDFETFSPDSANSSGAWDGTVEDDDSFDYTISSDEANPIRWMRASQSTLLIGTGGGEWTVGSTSSVVTPTDIVVNPATSHGSSTAQPLGIGAVVLFVQKAMRKIREAVFDFSVDGFQAFDMTRLAQHIAKKGAGFEEMVLAEEPDGLVWARRSDGVLPAMTYRREEDVVGWARHILGGSFSSGDAVVESIARIPGADGAGQVKSSENRDEVWLIVKRTINSATKRYVEVFEGTWEDGDDQEDAYYSDSIITYDGAATSTITGLGHLEGETVKVLADGTVHADRTVSSSQITLDDTYSVVQVGLGYFHTIKPLKLISGTAIGTPFGQLKQIFGVTFAVLDSHRIKFGPDENSLRTVDFRVEDETSANATPYYTGEWFTEWDDTWKTDPRVVIKSDDPNPFGLLHIAPEVETMEVK